MTELIVGGFFWAMLFNLLLLAIAPSAALEFLIFLVAVWFPIAMLALALKFWRALFKAMAKAKNSAAPLTSTRHAKFIDLLAIVPALFFSAIPIAMLVAFLNRS